MSIAAVSTIENFYGQLQEQWIRLLAKLNKNSPIPNAFENHIGGRELNPDMVTYLCSTYCQKDEENLNWAVVMKFLLSKIRSSKFVIPVVALSLILLLLGILIKLDKKSTKYEPTSPSSEEVIEEKEFGRERTHFPAAQRALLQFQKNRSDPIVFKYSYDLNEFDDIDTNGHICHEFKDNSQDLNCQDVEFESLPSASPIQKRSNDVINITTPTKSPSGKTVGNKAVCTPRKSAQNLPILLNPHLPLSVSPIKTSIQTTKLSSEQANAEPFKF